MGLVNLTRFSLAVTSSLYLLSTVLNQILGLIISVIIHSRWLLSCMHKYVSIHHVHVFGQYILLLASSLVSHDDVFVSCILGRSIQFSAWLWLVFPCIPHRWALGKDRSLPSILRGIALYIY